MTQPIWRNLKTNLAVPEAGHQWVLALDVLSSGKLMMIEAAGIWRPAGGTDDCTPDGFFSNNAAAAGATGVLLVDSAPRGALIARIGGSTADQKGDSPTATNPSRVLFSVGRKCIFNVPEKPVGSLFLGINDDPTKMASVTCSLTVNIYEAI